MSTSLKTSLPREAGLFGWARSLVLSIPLLNQLLRYVRRQATRVARNWPVIKGSLYYRLTHPRVALWETRYLGMAMQCGGWQAVKRALLRFVLVNPTAAIPHTMWLDAYAPDEKLLDHFRRRRWPQEAPWFSIVMPVYNVREEWLREAVESVLAQTYSRWELVCVNDGSPAPHIRPVLDELAARDERIQVIHSPVNQGVSRTTNRGLQAASGDYICFMDHDDVLEPHALHRFAEAVLADHPDLLYSDEAVADEDVREILHIHCRGEFSYDYYLSHPYFVHLIGVRAGLVRQVGGLDEQMKVSQDVDLVLRLIEVCRTVCHVPDVLYRWRTHKSSLGHAALSQVQAATRGALERHLTRLGVPAHIDDATHHNFRDVRFQPPQRAKVAIIIPTKNQVALLRNCIESLERTVPASLADIVVIDHQSQEPESRAYLDALAGKHYVIPYEGPFNFSAIINHGVHAVRGLYTHYLFLNNDTAAGNYHWLEHMLGFAQRPDVGIVGATLLYPDHRVQHAGVLVGQFGVAEHAYKFWNFFAEPQRREIGEVGGLLANRDYSAVTGACMLMRADVFDQAGGFDERLAVGFNDTDICLRVKSLGYKVIQDAFAILFHYESQSRGLAATDPHPKDTARFISRHRKIVFQGDPYYSPLQSTNTTFFHLDRQTRCRKKLRCRTTKVVLPGRAAA